MNFGEAVAHVLRHKSQYLLRDFWREDVVGVLSDVVSEGITSLQKGRQQLKDISLKELPLLLLGSTQEILEIAKVVPGRIRNGLSGFQSELSRELESKADTREKAMFGLKVMGFLSTNTLSFFYNLRGSGKDLRIGRLRIRNALAKFILAELVLRSLKLFLGRFLTEIEKELSSESDLEHVRYFKKLIEGPGAASSDAISKDDPAFRIADNLRKAILDGDEA